MKQSTWMRPLLACIVVAVLGVAACQTPTEYEVPVGQHLEFNIDGAAKSGDMELAIQAVLQFCETWNGVENLWVNEQQENGNVRMDISAWGQSLDGDALLAALYQEFPWLQGAEVTIEPLTGTVEGSMADRVGHALFDFEVDGATAEEIRAQILAQMAEQGLNGDAVVEILDEDGYQTITVEVDGETQEADGTQGGTEDVFIIERKTD